MKKLFFLGATMSMALCANAQSLDNPKLMPKESSISVIPKELSYDGTNRIVIPTGGSKNDDPTHYTIYSNDFEELKTIQNAGSTTEYKYMSIEQKELLSASFDSEKYVVMGTEESGNGGKKARKAKSGEEPNSYVIAPYITFESEPTKAQVVAALQALGYTPEEDLYDYNGYSYYVIAREDSVVNGIKFSYPTQMVRIVSYSGGTYRARLYKLYYVDIYVYSETDYSCYPSYDNYGYMQTTFAGWKDDEIKDYLNEYLSDNYAWFYYDYENHRNVYLEEVITVATDPNNKKWFVCVQEQAGKFVLNRAGYVLQDGILYMSGYQGNATYSYGDQEVDVFADVRTSKSSPYGVYLNYDIANASYTNIYLTQKLFNSDAQYEYITFTPIVKKFLVDSFSNGYSNYFDIDGEETKLNFPGEGKIYHEQVLYNGLNVVSESGNSIFSVTFPANFVAIYDDYTVFVLEGKKYIAVNGYLNYKYSQYGYNEDNIDATLIYQIGSNGSTSLAPVSDPIRVSVRPTYLGQDEAVTISTNENFKRNGQVRVVDMQGRVMQHKQIPAGQQSMQMHNLPQGVNFVQVMDGNQTIHTQPVIVK